ncbi:MAG: hypothetical protein AYP45_11620 [Candidatus Brocadia carolinensis]|uniref:phospholipase D n=1 Tax=Candidatus Brocadia carolinensis TaxID=1004156 RepID=A0A1V4AS45_9BACT|nr:MAG: hypothetical protein AYP45_11620 [Candidatus Brocadia caroliniensis]
MNFKKGYWAVIILPWISLLSMHESAFSSDVYFASREIKGQILSTIEGCRYSIDIAVSDITAHDFLSALVKAQKRGVHVRIIVSKKHALTKGPLAGLDKDEKFAIKVLPQKERMQNNFAIFDAQLLAMGSYPWRKNIGKEKRYDMIFTDETKLVVKYQKEFEQLFHEGGATGRREHAVVEGKERGKPADTAISEVVPKELEPERQVVASNYGIVITETSQGFIDMSFEEFDKVFGMTSDLSDEQKESLWNRCEGKRIKWKGEVTYIGWGLVTGWMMSIKYGDTSVEIKLNSAHKQHFSHAKLGNTVTYTGKLASRVTRVFPYKLEDGDVLEIVNTLPKPVHSSNLTEDPYVVPVSQGPKKIFLIDSFEDLDSIFGKESKVSEAQKKIAWEKYKGKYVSWTGQIVYKNVNVAAGLRMGVMQKEKGDVEVKISLAKKDKVLKFHDGETILYTGKLVERRGNNTPYVLEDGDIITLKAANTGLGGL